MNEFSPTQNLSSDDKPSLDTVNHIAIRVQDIKDAVEWYSKTFNCAVEYQDQTWAYLKFANIRLALVMADEHPSHLAFIVDNPEKYGVLETHRDGTRSVYINDPAGNTIEFMNKQ